MKSMIIGLALVVLTGTSQAELLEYKSTGHYRLGENDTISDGLAMAEHRAIDSAISGLRAKVLSIRSIDKNGYLSRAGWLVKSAVVRSKRTNEETKTCQSGDGICATVDIEAQLDTEVAQAQIELIYSERKLQMVVEQMLESESVREKALLNGSPANIAELKQRQTKRQEVLSYMVNRKNSQSAGVIDWQAIEDDIEAQGNTKPTEILTNSANLEYNQMLLKVKNNISFEVIKQEYTEQYNQSGLAVTLKYNTPELTELLHWLARYTGSSGSPQQHPVIIYRRKHKVQFENSADLHEALGHPSGAHAATLYHIDYYRGRKPAFTNFVYGSMYKDPNKDICYGKSACSQWVQLNQNILNGMKQFAEYRLCTYMSIAGKESSFFNNHCLVTGKKPSGRWPMGKPWDNSVPYIKVASPKIELPYFIPIDIKQLKAARQSGNANLMLHTKIERIPVKNS